MMAKEATNHVHWVGEGIRLKMAELGDSPSTCEQYPFEGEARGDVAVAWGQTGIMYSYVSDLNQVFVYPTLDMMLAGGLV